MSFRRTREGKILAGVCSGLARQFGWDPNIIRLVLAIVTLLTSGTAAVIYGLAWLLIPEEGQDKSIAQRLIDNNSKH
ncbi:MAG: putative stress-responsive transcriptional regulator protein-like protein [Streptosporangiaceae bacterium]|nr:putative stress-responsive transcriptional regulator protein-like protein [Streptosporangiaceae bacterium]